MKILYDEDFLEGAVRLCESGAREIPSLQLHRYHFERARLYAIMCPDERNDAFFELYLRWFRAWGLEEEIAGALGEFPRLPSRLDVMALRKARRAADEGSELYVRPDGGRHGVLGLRIERLSRDSDLNGFLLHELTHLDDMLDPGFGYSPELPDAGPAACSETLIRSRYRLLWDITIEGRLARRREAPQGTEAALLREFQAAFGFWQEEQRAGTFQELWTNSAPKHDQLMALATDPRGLAARHEPVPGARCPLCGFPTFEWARFDRVHPRAVKAIRVDYPDWRLAHGACARCAEIYSSKSFELPATLFLERGG